MPMSARSSSGSSPLRHGMTVGWLLIATSVVTLLGAAFANVASAATSTVNLGNAAPFAVLAGTTVTNTGSSTISGSVGVSPGSAITGFPPGLITNGTTHGGDATALAAQTDATAAYLDAAGRTPFTVDSSDLGGQSLSPGVYQNAAATSLTGTVTLNGQGDPNAVFIFQTGSTLITAPSSTVSLINGAQACNVFWQVGSSATLGTGTSFAGTILALTSISAQTGATVSGRLLARNGQVSLDANVVTTPTCLASTPTTTVPATTTTTVPPTTTTTTTIPPVIATTTTFPAAPLPHGSPGTGFGGSAHNSRGGLLFVGVSTLLAGVLILGESVRRARSSGATRRTGRGH